MTETLSPSASTFEAIAVAQATYGVPDKIVARIAQCSESQIVKTRKLIGWTKRKVSLAFMKGASDAYGKNTEQACDVKENISLDINVESLQATIEKLLWRLTHLVAVTEIEDLDPMLPKHIDAIGTALKYLEKLKEMCRDLKDGTGVREEDDPAETARVLQIIDNRVEELAEQKMREMLKTHAKN